MIEKKKGEVEITITWVAVVLFIALVLIVWVLGSVALAKTKKLGNQVEFEESKGLEDLQTQEVLISLLNSALTESKSVREKIIEVENGESEYDDFFKKEVREILSESSDIFIFEIDGRKDFVVFYPEGVIRSSLYESKVSIFVNDKGVEITLKRK